MALGGLQGLLLTYAQQNNYVTTIKLIATQYVSIVIEIITLIKIELLIACRDRTTNN